MSLPNAVYTMHPKWKFWAGMNRAMLDSKGEQIGNIKQSFVQTVSLFDAEGQDMVVSKLQLGAKAALFDGAEKAMGLVRQLHIPAHGSFSARDAWGVEYNEAPYIYMNPAPKSQAADFTKDSEFSLADADDEIYQFVKEKEVIGVMVSATGGLDSNHHAFFASNVSDDDKKLCLTLMGFQMFDLLKD